MTFSISGLGTGASGSAFRVIVSLDTFSLVSKQKEKKRSKYFDTNFLILTSNAKQPLEKTCLPTKKLSVCFARNYFDSLLKKGKRLSLKRCVSFRFNTVSYEKNYVIATGFKKNYINLLVIITFSIFSVVDVDPMLA